MCIAEFVEISKDIVITIGTCIAGYVALEGLDDWKRQLKGNAEYDLTRRLLRCTYKLRDAMKGVRNPFMFGDEMQSPPTEAVKKMSREELSYQGKSTAYQKRWDRVSEVLRELQAELLEGEVLWGKIIHEKFEPLFKLQRELFTDVHSYLMMSNPSEHEASRSAISKIRQARREVLYDMGIAQEPDAFSADVENAITDIETFLMPHLKK